MVIQVINSCLNVFVKYVASTMKLTSMHITDTFFLSKLSRTALHSEIQHKDQALNDKMDAWQPLHQTPSVLQKKTETLQSPLH